MGLFSFFDRFRGSGASSGDRSPYGEFWFEPVSARTGSGMRVSPDSALRLAAVYACVRILAETMASLPLVVYQRRADGGKDKVTDHWLCRLMAKRPNRFQNPFEWREMLQGHLALRGNAYNQIITNPRGEIIELMPIHPDRVKIELLPSGEYRYRVTDRSGTGVILPRGEVWHLRGLSSDGLMGMSPIELARENLGMALAAQDYGARFFANDAKPTGGWIEFPGTFKDNEAKKVFRESYQQAQSGANRGKVLVLENGMKFHEVGVTNKDAQFLELRKFQITDIARLFRVPPHMIADLERATFSNIEQQSLEFVMHTMTPWAERWEASIESELLLEGDDIEIEFDFANLMRGDAASRSSYYQSGIQNGWLTRNEARIAENLNPIDGLDQPLRPLNMVEEDAAEDLEIDTQAEAAEPPEQKAIEPAEDESVARLNGRFNALVQTTSERLARRIGRSGHLAEKDILLISQALAVPLDRVQLWSNQIAEPLDQTRLTESLISLGQNL
ncbi:phage portal protein [Sphingorhabdus sp.]|uniref:phage portal protein n=1 Tax=Sphingorhabdus sp. TaxID=1902408 RepID=UPI0033403BCF